MTMLTIKELPDEQAKSVIEHHEFDQSIRNVSRYVAVVMTQDWCSQWKSMETWLNPDGNRANPIKEDITVFTLMYNRKPYFQDFLNFKESVWENDRIPYVRYYKNNRFITSTNYVSRDQFFRCFA